jgi:polysaccharide export outer membrane protein
LEVHFRDHITSRFVERKLHTNKISWIKRQTRTAGYREGRQMLKLWILAILLPVTYLSAADKLDAPPKDLVDYIRHSKSTGTSNDQIRRNAMSAGWDPKLVDEAFAISERPPSEERTPSGSSDLPEGYRIGPGDVLQISVFREPDASVPSAAVRSDGKISMPLIKEVEIIGLTATEAEKRIAERLSQFIHGPEVTVIVSQINSRKVYLVGGVRSVGAIDIKGPMTVLQAITHAGGLTDYAKRKQIYVLRTENGRQLKLLFNYEAVLKGEKMEQNILLAPNDTVVVPQ